MRAYPGLIKKGHGIYPLIEWLIVKTHPTRGTAPLDASLRQYPGMAFLEIARDIAWCHHERYDGSGYPRGLKGEEIPLAGRIVALADTYDTLASKRMHDEAFTPYVTYSIIVEERGKHFDPDAVEAYLAGESLFVEVFKSCLDKKQ